MHIHPDYHKAFKQSVVELCESVGKEKITVIERIFQQNDKTDEEVISMLILAFPEFLSSFSSNLK